MDLGGASWGIMLIIAPLLLAAVIIYAALKNRSSRATREKSEQATEDLYRKEDIAHRNDDDHGT